MKTHDLKFIHEGEVDFVQITTPDEVYLDEVISTIETTEKWYRDELDKDGVADVFSVDNLLQEIMCRTKWEYRYLDIDAIIDLV